MSPKKPIASSPVNTLRERAEELAITSATEIEGMSSEGVQRLVHELQIHQIELELQNEELRKSQLELAQARDRLSDLYEYAPVGYLALDRRGTILEANLATAEILGTHRASILGRPLASFMSTDDGDLLYLHLLRVFETGVKHVCDLQLVGQDELPRNVRLESIRSLDEQDLPRTRTIMGDITELTQAQDAAQRSQRLAALGTLAAGIAHEINNPLWMITLQADVALDALEKGLEGSPTITDCLQEIKQLVEHGGQIINGVLRFSKQDPTEKSVQSVDEVIRRARDFTRARADQKQVKVEYEVAEDLPYVSINATEMEQVFVNLLVNAIEASDTGSSVRLIAAWNSEILKLRIEDDGCGISREDSKHVFDPFYTTRRRDGGTGLGLNVVHRIVEDHNGNIELTSQLGKGTTVTVCLPITSHDVR